MNEHTDREIRVLLLLDESWNDDLYPNNNMTNWFGGFEHIRLFTVSGSSTYPKNDCCDDYFLIGENEMIKSLFGGKKVGHEYRLDKDTAAKEPAFRVDVGENAGIKRIFSCETARLCQDLVWRFGRYDTEKLKDFLGKVKPDVIFSQRRANVKMCRLESTVLKYCDAPMLVYTGDDDYSLRQFSLSPVFWLRRFWVRKWIKKMMKQYRLVYSQSKSQMEEFEKAFGVDTEFLVKCGEFTEDKVHKTVHSPIHLVYAGKLYCNRWRTLKKTADEIAKINHESGNAGFVLDIYTRDRISKKQNRALNDGVNSVIHGAAAPEELAAIYQNSDIALHVEGLDLRNRLLTRHSFSTKVMDCLGSGCALMIFSWKEHSAYRVFSESGAAFTVDSGQRLYEVLSEIRRDSAVITDYANRAFVYGIENHNKKMIQKMLYEDFRKAVN